MPRSVNNLIDRVKTSCDNQTYLYVFGDEAIGHAYHKDIIDKKWESRLLSKQYFESDEFQNLDQSIKDKFLYVGVKAYDAEELDPVNNLPVKNPKVYEYSVHGTGKIWKDTGTTAEHKIVDNGYGITEEYYGYYDENETYRIKTIMRRMNHEPCTNIYYKNVDGMWIDYYKYINSLPTYNIDTASRNWPDIMKIEDTSILPKCKYIDANGYLYDIDAGDGKNLELGVPSVEVDTNNNETVVYEPYSIDKPDLQFSKRHGMEDLKVTIPDGMKRQNFLVWLNGAFVPTTASGVKDNIFYIKGAMSMIGSRMVNQVLGATHKYGDGATIIEDEKFNEYRYDVNLRFFGWDGIAVSDFYKPYASTQTPITYNYQSVHIIKSITFPEDINRNAHIIICNGKILDPDEYIVESDGRTVTLKNVEMEAYELLNEIVTDINENSTFYENVNPLKMISRVLVGKTYSLVNFSSEDPTKDLNLYISSASCVNFPYKNEVTFPIVNIGDLVLMKGLFIPFEWIHKSTIRYPKMATSYSDGEIDNIREDDVKRYYFVLKDK